MFNLQPQNQPDPSALMQMLQSIAPGMGAGAAGALQAPTGSGQANVNFSPASMLGPQGMQPKGPTSALSQALEPPPVAGAAGGGAIPGGATIANPDIAGSTAGAATAGAKASGLAGGAMSWMDKAMPWLMALQVLGGSQMPQLGTGKGGGG